MSNTPLCLADKVGAPAPGWRLVPEEPTPEMLQAMVKSRHGPAAYKVSMATQEEEEAAEDYRAALAASPTVPAPKEMPNG